MRHGRSATLAEKGKQVEQMTGCDSIKALAEGHGWGIPQWNDMPKRSLLIATDHLPTTDGLALELHSWAADVPEHADRVAVERLRPGCAGDASIYKKNKNMFPGSCEFQRTNSCREPNVGRKKQSGIQELCCVRTVR